MRPFEWVQPTDIENAVLEVAAGGMLVAGGTTVFDLLKLGHPAPARMIDISRLSLADVTVDETDVILGGTLSNTDAAMSPHVRTQLPAVSEAILSGASRQIRNAATIAGNLMQATRCVYFRNPRWTCNRRMPGSGCSAFAAPQPGHAILGVTETCMAVHPSDLSVALAALDAVVVTVSRAGRIHQPLSHFYKLPDDLGAHDKRVLPGSVITAVRVPMTTLASRSGYLKLRHRASYEFASASVAAGLVMDGDVIREVAVALGGVATIPWRDRSAEATLLGRRPTTEVVDEFCDRIFENAVLGENTAYKRDLARGGIHRLLQHLASSQVRS